MSNTISAASNYRSIYHASVKDNLMAGQTEGISKRFNQDYPHLYMRRNGKRCRLSSVYSLDTSERYHRL
jgi:hypothetical protein